VGDGNDPPTLGVTFKVNEVVAVKNTGSPVLLSVNHFHLSMVRRSTTAPILLAVVPDISPDAMRSASTNSPPSLDFHGEELT
jgi:hypothetical protein